MTTAPPRYAASTDVSSDRSRAEIEKLVRRYGGRQFAYAWEEEGAHPRAVLAFVLYGRQVRFLLPLPDRGDREFTRTANGRDRSATAAEAAYEQAIRSAWRSLTLVIKAKLEAVASQIVTFEEEFLAHIVLPEGDTVGERLHPALARTFADGVSPPQLLPPPPAGFGQIEGPR